MHGSDDEDEMEGNEVDNDEIEEVDDEVGVQLRAKTIEESNEEHDLSVTLERGTHGRSDPNDAQLTSSILERAATPTEDPSISSRPDAHPPRDADTDAHNDGQNRRMDFERIDESILSHIVQKVTNVIDDRFKKAVEVIIKR